MRQWWNRVRTAYYAYHTRAKGPYPLVMISVVVAALVSSLCVSYFLVERVRVWLEMSPQASWYAVLALAVWSIVFTGFLYCMAWVTSALLASLGIFTRNEARNFAIYGEYPERWLR